MSEFYVGYMNQMAPAMRKRVRRFVGLVAILACTVGIGLMVTMRPFAAAVFEYGIEREFTGTIRTQPVPMLMMAAESGPESQYLLVNPGKFGAALSKWDGLAVHVKGTLVYRDGRTMIEIRPQSLRPTNAPAAALDVSGNSYEATLVGEIVDSKCFLGVMNPADLRSHQACAIRCISGGIPPLLVVRQSGGTCDYYLLVDRQGKPLNRQILDRIAVPVKIRGVVERNGEWQVLRARIQDIQAIEKGVSP